MSNKPYPGHEAAIADVRQQCNKIINQATRVGKNSVPFEMVNELLRRCDVLFNDAGHPEPDKEKASGMTKDEAKTVIGIFANVDAGCPVCVEAAVSDFIKAFPHFREVANSILIPQGFREIPEGGK
ncbi:MAG: hypothetical protein GC190_19235 [Alphaproteobacteria bacterium]|nr:hypothetical protein [Alphaproteobacteria bacterium]